MKTRLVKLITLAALVGFALFVILPSYKTSSASNVEDVGAGYSTVETLEARYAEWEAQYEKAGGDRNWTIPIGWFKGLSTEQSYGHGAATVNLIDGVVALEVEGLPKGESWD